MKIFIVALMALVDGSAPGFEPPSMFVFTHINFATVEECKEYVVLNSDKVMYKLWMEYGNTHRPHMISCVNENVVEEIIQEGIAEEDGISL